ncbi:Uma2 family endonuclease [Spirulina sp. CS-785/01]|uniref:Uma2 family endonuclease n=1 Tax=Spirulina sp. CS-785/01 TaxID=3021716 RepID=UPI00232E10A4|nr:Uma2 family endonuclease [Spirulina sp. CS-785/01]MDB9312085.1 Uma2 family endonuclease [Spirulina sp. CS-785/01]
MYPQLTLPPQLSLKLSQADFMRLVLANQDLRLERTATGELVVNPPTGGETGRRNRRLTGECDRWIEENPELGEGFDSSTGFILPNGAIRSPDVSWVSRERWESLTPEQREGFIPLCPDFVVELRSKSDNLATLREKMQEYLDNGTQLGWLIDPQTRPVEVYRPQQAVEVLENPTVLSGEGVLLGFRFNVSRIW